MRFRRGSIGLAVLFVAVTASAAAEPGSVHGSVALDLDGATKIVPDIDS